MKFQVDEKLELVPINLDYTDDIYNNFTDDIIKHLPIEKLSDKKEDTITFIKSSTKHRQKKTDLIWVILNENLFAGCCGIHSIQTKQPHFGIWIKKELQGNGIGKKIVSYVLNWGISNLDVEFIKYPVDRRNTRSVKLIKGLDLKLCDHYQIGKNKILEIDEYRLYQKYISK
jgi:RimJ/RimL family protein N-acetyltransferase